MVAVLIATTNRGKIDEVMPLLAGLPIELVTLADREPWRIIAPPEETARTFAGNARLKARYYAAATGLPTVAEDSGLEIDALDGAPGVESARWGGAEVPYSKKFELIYQALNATGRTDRTARFVCAVALVLPIQPYVASPSVDRSSDVIFETTGTIEGQIATKPSGTGGFGYDPIFYYPPFGTTLAEAATRKSEVSHRGKAFRALEAFLREKSGSAAGGDHVWPPPGVVR
jgi:XTP/dITP diphosphohydrolase